jgi:23S rRNA (pseudouridine1915-N3)-methyltransferase
MIKIICFGSIKELYLKELISDYEKRINKYHKLEIIELKDDNDIKKETNSLLKVFNQKEYNIALCIDGKSYDSVDFANHLDNLFNYNSVVTFVIGGSNGLDESVIKMCKEKISFSTFTFPHGLFRGILLEQIYRSLKINNNEAYHK